MTEDSWSHRFATPVYSYGILVILGSTCSGSSLVYDLKFQLNYRFEATKYMNSFYLIIAVGITSAVTKPMRFENGRSRV